MGPLGRFSRLDDFLPERICGLDGGFGTEDDRRPRSLSGDDRAGPISDPR